jgi:KamA family protein
MSTADTEGSAAVEISTGGRMTTVAVAQLVEAVTEFLELYGEPPLVPPPFRELIGDGDGEQRLARLLAAAGFPDDEVGFFAAVLDGLSAPEGRDSRGMSIEGAALPYQLLLTVLEVATPGDEIFGVKTVRRLERLTGLRVPSEERDDLQEVLECYPVRLSSHVIRQMRLSPAVAYQYLPVAEELQPDGLKHTWVGQFHRGVVEQMYRNRVIFVLNMSCPVYCRFCFRKHKECRAQRPPSQRHVDLGVAYIKSCPEIKEVVLTGGDPFMNRATLTRAIDGLGGIPHIETLRIATRSVAYHPALFTARDGFWLDYLKRKQLELRQRGTSIEVATHFIHPDEISVRSLDLITELVGSGVPVYIQTPFLGGCNDSAETMAELFAQLRAVGAEIHYVFLPCSPIQGNARYRAPISSALETACQLRARLGDRAMPRFCTATAIGKVDWGTSGWVVEVDDDDDSFLWIRTPYNHEYFETFAPILDLSQVARPNSEGTLDAKFMAEIGDDRLLAGPRETAGHARAYIAAESFPDELSSDALARLQYEAREDDGRGWTVPAKSWSSIVQVHATRVELDCEADEPGVEAALSAVESDSRISDVVLVCRRGVARSLHRISRVVEQLYGVRHVTAVRIRSAALGHHPEQLTDGVVKRLASLNRLTVVRPTRVEVETRFLHSSEITADHGRVARALRQRGVSTVASIPLLRFVNDGDGELAAITDACRRLGMEVHHLCVAGLPIQDAWSREHPVHASQVIDLVTELRRSCSGRQLPHLVVRTAFGEVDFGLSGKVVGSDADGWARLALLAYTVDGSGEVVPGLARGDEVEVDPNGHPIVSVPGLIA